eukprot:GHVU01053742.1.p1 GENE.GHVU01053742.1~~GHVU01053742.1.p1  ORF type:complete len:380 (-),score=36.35 GHVU01053742.1:536-1675(-)
MSTGMAASYYAVDSYWLFMLTYGLMYGSGIGLSYSVALSNAMKWLPERRGLGAGIITAGFGAGALVFSQVQMWLINPDDKKPLDVPYPNLPNERYFDDLDILERVPECLAILGGIYFAVQLLGVMLIRDRPADDVNRAIAAAAAKDPMNHTGLIAPPPEDMGVGAALKTTRLLRLWTYVLLNGLALTGFTTFWKQLGGGSMGDGFLTRVGAAGSLCNAFGRIFWGAVSDKNTLLYAMTLQSASWALCLLAATVFAYVSGASKVLYVLIVCGNFFSLSGVFALAPAATAASFGRKNMGSIYGFVFSAIVVGSFAISCMAKHIFRAFGTSGYFGFSAACMAVATAFMVYIKSGAQDNFNERVANVDRKRDGREDFGARRRG